MIFIFQSGLPYGATENQVNNNTFGGYIKQHKGDTMVYKAENILDGRDALYFSNNTYFPYAVTNGMTYKVQFINNNESVLCQVTITFSNGSIFLSSAPIKDYYFINYAFDNESSAKQYAQQENSFLSQNVTIQGSYLIINSEHPDNYKLAPTKVFLMYKYNWKTGWLQSYNVTSYLSNGTIYQQMTISVVNNSAPGFIGLTVIPIFLLMGLITNVRKRKKF